jgi:hypothetical protein
VGLNASGWVFVHRGRWRALLAFVPEAADPQDPEPTVGEGRKVRVVGFGEGGVMQVVPTRPPDSGRALDRPGRQRRISCTQPWDCCRPSG